MRAYELFVQGHRRADIARELGLTKATIGAWAKADQWEGRMERLVATANEAADHVVGDQLAHALAQLKLSVVRRVKELESLCGPSQEPGLRLRAIQAWLKLAGIDKALPHPTSPTTKADLTLLEDLLDKDKEEEDDGLGIG
jgi:predicted transcriptional regulator